MSDTSQGEGWWIAADGKWYPPDAAPSQDPSGQSGVQAPRPAQPAVTGSSSSPGGIYTFIGWLVVIGGFAVFFATMAELSSDENEYLDPSLGDYIIATSSGMVVIGIGASAAALGAILNRIGRS